MKRPDRVELWLIAALVLATAAMAVMFGVSVVAALNSHRSGSSMELGLRGKILEPALKERPLN